MSFSRKVHRAVERRGKEMLRVPVLNEHEKRMEVPRGYRDELLAHYGIRPAQLTGSAAFHITFVEEGVVFGFISLGDDERARVTLHVIDLTEPETHSLVGTEIVSYWENLSVKMPFDELRANYQEMIGTLS